MGRHRVQEATRKLDWFNQSRFLRPLVLRFDSFSQSIITSRRQKPERSASRRTRQASGPVSPGERNVMIFEIRSQRWRSRLRPAVAGLRRGKARTEVRHATASPSNGGHGEPVLRPRYEVASRRIRSWRSAIRNSERSLDFARHDRALATAEHTFKLRSPCSRLPAPITRY